MEYAGFGGRSSAPKSTAPTARYPVVKINHDRGVFFGSDAGHSVLGKTLDIVVLGLVRQRELWVDGESGRKQACESPDATTGYAKANYFDYEAAGFDRRQFPGPPSGEIVKLACDYCELRKWQDNPGGNRKPPPCTSSWVLPFIYARDPIKDAVDLLAVARAQPDELEKSVHLLPVKFSSQRSLEKYLTPFRDSKTPTYTVRTRVTLSRREKDGRRFSDASFEQLDQVNGSVFSYMSGALRTVREYLIEPPQVPQGSFKPMQMGRP